MLPSITLGSQTVYLYNVIVITEYLSVPVIMLLLRKRFGVTRKKALGTALFTLVCGFFALQLTSVIANGILTAVSGGNFSPYEQQSSYGLPLFIPVFFVPVCLLFRKSFRRLTDYAAPCVFCVQMLGKVACSFNGCCYGPECDFGFYSEIAEYKTFPVQVFDAATCALIFILCLILTFTFAKKHQGYLFPICGTLYAAQKAFWEEFRVYPNEWEGNFLGTGRTYWQYFLCILLVGSLIWLIGVIRWEKKGKPDFDTATFLHVPDLGWELQKAYKKVYDKLAGKDPNKTAQHHKKKKKKNNKSVKTRK